MINQVNSAGYQSYSYQQSSSTSVETQQDFAAKDNRVQPRDAQPANAQKQDPREFASRDAPEKSTPPPANDAKRGKSVDLST